MESLSEHEAMRVLQAAAAMDALRAASGARANALAVSRSPTAPALQQHQSTPATETLQSPAQGVGEDVWRELAETDGGACGGESSTAGRRGDLDSWTDVFRATASSVRNAWRHVECLSYESLAFGWLVLARKHEPLHVAPPTAACGEDVAAAPGGADSAAIAGWLSAAQWAQAAYQASEPERLTQMLGLQPGDLLDVQLEGSGWRPGFFLAVHHDSRTVRLVVRGSGHPRDLLANVAGHSSPLGPGFAHHGMLSGAQQLLERHGGRLRAALEAHPGYGLHFIGHSLGAGTAALLALLVALGDARAEPLGLGAAQDGDSAASKAAVRATCFAAPPVVTAELAEQCGAYVDSITYNADLVSRCSAMSLRRLANEMSAASEEVLARSELAQALRRSGALGLANHVVAAALCRCQPWQDTTVSPHATPPPGGVSTRGPVAEGLTQLAGATLVRPVVPPPVTGAAAATTAAALGLPAQPNGRITSLSALGPQLKATESHKGGLGLAPVHTTSIRPPSPTPAPPAPLGPPSGALPPLLVTAASAGGPAANGSPLRIAGPVEPPPRKLPEPQGVLSPPPLVAAAAAVVSSQGGAAATAAAAGVPAAAVGPTPPRRGLVGFIGDIKAAVVPHDVRQAAAGSQGVISPFATSAAGDGPMPAAGGGGGGGNGVLLEPLPAPPTLPAALSSAVPSGYPSQRREAAALVADVVAVIGSPGPGGNALLPLPPLLPPLLLPQVNVLASASVSAAQSRAASPRASRQASMREGHALAPPLAPLAPELLVTAASAVAAAPGGEKPGRGPLGNGLDGVSAGLGLALPQQQQEGGAEAAAGGSPSQPCHELMVPGCVHLLERRGADATASFRLIRDFGRSQLNRILLKRSMLRDHLLSHYIAALERLGQVQAR